MGQGEGRQSRAWIRGAILGLWAVSLPAAAQETSGDQGFRFDFSQKFGANDNLRLAPNSVGTTYYSDTGFTLGYRSETALQQFDISVGGLLRAASDPTLGTDAQFRDPTVDLTFARTTANARVSLFASYARPDLAFLDPLQQSDISTQDLSLSGGQRQDIKAGVRLETGLQAPLGFVFDLNTRSRDYINTTDPLLVPNQTDSAQLGARFRFSPVMLGRVDWYESRYDQEENVGATTSTARQSGTRRLTAGLDVDLSPVSMLALELGQSKVTETFDATPGVINRTRGFVGSATFTRLLPNGQASADLGSTLTTQGRQTTLEFGRVFDLPAGGLDLRLGVTGGASFDALPIGGIDYTADLPRGRLTAGLSRAVSISDTLNQATTTTRASLGYRIAVNNVSDLAFDVSYADIGLASNSSTTGVARERGNFTATYSHDLTQDWDLQVGYAYRYYNPDTTSAARSNEIFFTLERKFEVFR